MNRRREILTLEELVERTNSELRRLPAGDDAAPFVERTIRYYVAQGLLPRSGTRGPGARYPEGLVWRLLFIRRLQREAALTLEHIRQAVETVSEDTMQRVVLGKEELNIRGSASAAVLARRGASGERGEMMLPSRALPTERASKNPKSYLDQVADQFGRPTTAKPADEAKRLRSRTLWKNERAMIRVRGAVTPAQQRQLEHLGALLANILEEGEQ